MSRRYQQDEYRLVAEWVVKNYPYEHVEFGMRLGPDAFGIMKPTAPKVDAFIHTSPNLTLVEGKIDNESQALGQLLYYRFLVPRTPGYQHVDPMKIGLIIILVRDLPLLEEFAHSLGISVVKYCPDWIRERATRG